jgi:hypothetical protein
MELALVDQHYFVIDMDEGNLTGVLITRVFLDYLLEFYWRVFLLEILNEKKTVISKRSLPNMFPNKFIFK